MVHYFLAVFVLILLLAILYVSVIIGRHIGLVHLQKQPQHKLEIVSIAESSVFALLALLIAFTFSGAYERFENRKLHLLDEANIFDKAYRQIDLIHKDLQPGFRADVRQYLDQYIAAFKDIPYFSKVDADLRRAQVLEDQIWSSTVIASRETTDKVLAQVYIPAFNDMFEAAHKGFNLTKVHSPPVILLLLIGLAVLGAFLVGYNSAENKHKRPLHSLCYVLLTAFTIYIILNIEFPRVGFIGMNTFDQILIDVRNNMV